MSFELTKDKPVSLQYLENRLETVLGETTLRDTKMKIAVIGEGPIGLCISNYLVYLISKGLSADVTLYIKRGEYLREQTLQVSTDILIELEKMMECNGEECFHKTGRITNIQVKCIEQLLYSRLSTINIKDAWSESTNMVIYDHIFLADGYNSPSRNHYFGKIDPIAVLFANPMFMIFSNIIDCEHLPYSKVFSLLDIDREVGNGEEIGSLISMVYNLNKWSNKLTPQPYGNVSIDRWTIGFENMADYEATFTKGIQYITSTMKHDSRWKRIYAENNVGITDGMNAIINDHHITLYFDNLKKFILPHIEEDKKFVAHYVKPSSTPFGIHLNKPELQYCKQVDRSKVWIVGDSCNAFPPGNSIELGIIDIFNLMHIIFKDHEIHRFLITLPNPRYTQQILKCDVSGILTWNNCEQLESYIFTGGYPIGDSKNEGREFKNFKTELEKYARTACSRSTTDLDEYNKYQFKNYFNNLFNLACDSSHSLMGGKRRHKTRRHKTRRHKTRRHKTRRYRTRNVK
jgi:hypothetical protein